MGTSSSGRSSSSVSTSSNSTSWPVLEFCTKKGRSPVHFLRSHPISRLIRWDRLRVLYECESSQLAGASASCPLSPSTFTVPPPSAYSTLLSALSLPRTALSVVGCKPPFYLLEFIENLLTVKTRRTSRRLNERLTQHGANHAEKQSNNVESTTKVWPPQREAREDLPQTQV